MAGLWRSEQPESLEHGNWLCEQSGFSLVETIVAMLLVAILITALVPLFSYVHKNLIMNTTKVVAYNLAESTIEAIKAASWDDIGTIGGDPSGEFETSPPPVTYPASSTPNISYAVTTQIRWDPDYSRSSNPNDSSNGDMTDYKDISVEVKATNTNNSAMTYVDITLNTKVTKESGEEPGGTNIIVTADKAWGYGLPSDTSNLPPAQGNVTIILQGPSPSTAQVQAPTDAINGDMPGQALFPTLTAGTYTITASDSDSDGLMVLPAGKYGNGQITTLQTDQTNQLSLEVEYPCHLDLSFYDPVYGTNPSISAAVTLIPPGDWDANTADAQYCGITSESATATYSGSGWPWPYNDQNIWPSGAGSGYWTGQYDLKVTAISGGSVPYNNYQLSKTSPAYKDWDGQFDGFNGTGSVTVTPTLYLTPSPAVKVTSAGSPVSGATVMCTAETYHGGGSWQAGTAYPCTSSNGDMYYFQNNLPVSPTDGYSCYGVTVNVGGTQKYNNIHAFWVDGNGYEQPISPSPSYSQQTGYQEYYPATY